jgi:hypothetical protein
VHLRLHAHHEGVQGVDLVVALGFCRFAVNYSHVRCTHCTRRVHFRARPCLRPRPHDHGVDLVAAAVIVVVVVVIVVVVIVVFVVVALVTVAGNAVSGWLAIGGGVQSEHMLLCRFSGV